MMEIQTPHDIELIEVSHGRSIEQNRENDLHKKNGIGQNENESRQSRVEIDVVLECESRGQKKEYWNGITR